MRTRTILLLVGIAVVGMQVIPFPVVHAWGGSIICGSIDGCWTAIQDCGSSNWLSMGMTSCQNKGGGGGRAYPV